MTVSLKPEFEKFVEEQVRTGQFTSRAEVLEAGLARLMLEPAGDELDDADVAAIEEAETQVDRGETRDWSVVSAELRTKYLGG